MLWQEEEPQTAAVTAQTVVDLVFDMTCRCLPVDHALVLSQALQQALPWFEQEPRAGLHLIHGAESGNGWYRPQEQGSLLYLSRRTKLTLRLPKHRIEEARSLTGTTLELGGYPLTVGKASEKPLRPMPVLFARHVLAESEQNEDTFLDSVVEQLQPMGIHCRKALCGKTSRFKWLDKELFTRSLMIADLTPPDSLALQEQGLGKGRKMGCGLFVPHKDIKPVNPDDKNH